MSQSVASEECCCPPFDPTRWNEKTHNWQGKPFVTDNIVQFLHIPLNIGRVIWRAWNRMLDAKAKMSAEESLVLFHESSPWRSQLFLSVSHEVPNAKNVKLSGRFVSKVFEGPYRETPKWISEMDSFLADQGKKPVKHYIHYAYCPKCAKKYGKNFGVVFAQLDSAD